MTCAIILPCYNPIDHWETTILQSMRDLQHRFPAVNFTLILVNDGSRKNIAEGAAFLTKKLPAFHYINNSENRGKGYALRCGVEAAEADFIIYTDVDFPYTTDSFCKILAALLQGQTDAAIGIKDVAYYRNVPPMRVYISKILRFFIGLLLRLSITDTQCGLKGFRNAVKPVFMQTTIDRYLFDLEFIYLLERNSEFKLQAIEIGLKDDIVFTKPRLSILFPEVLNFSKIIFKKWFG